MEHQAMMMLAQLRSKSPQLMGHQPLCLTGLPLQSTTSMMRQHWKMKYNRQTRTTDADKINVNGYISDIDFTIIEGFENLSGTVTFPDNAKAGEKAYIEAYSDETSTFGSAQIVYSSEKTVQYKISGLMNATEYVVMIESDNYQVQYFDQQYTVDYAAHIDTTDASADNAVNFTLYAGGSICGTTYDNDQPASDIIVVAYSNKTNALYGAISQDNGRYCIYGLGMSDDYELKASRSSNAAPFYYNETKTSRDQGIFHQKELQN
jgi:hypothetical protein